MRICITLLGLAALLQAAPAQAEPKKKARVFYLNSYHNGYDWSDNILSGLRQVLLEDAIEVELHVEYMDVKKFPSREVREELLRLFLRKYSGEDFDVIVGADNAAFDFLLAHKDELFPGVPMVFAGVNDFHPPASRAGISRACWKTWTSPPPLSWPWIFIPTGKS